MGSAMLVMDFNDSSGLKMIDKIVEVSVCDTCL